MDNLLKLLNLTPTDARMIPIMALFFLVLWQLLSRLVFKPYLDLLELREAKTTGASDAAHEKAAQAQATFAEVENDLSQARIAAMKEKVTLVNKARAEAQQITEKADHLAQERLSEARENRDRMLGKLSSELEKESDELSNLISQKLKSGGAAIQ